MTAESKILHDLQHGNFTSLEDELQAYLAPAFEDGTDSNSVKILSRMACRFMHMCCTTQLDKVENAHLPSALRCVKLCHDVIRRHPGDQCNDLYLERLIYHVLGKIVKKGFYDESAEFAELLCNDVASQITRFSEKERDVANSLCHCAWVALWNGALQVEQSSISTITQVILLLRLRHLAIKLLLLSDKGMPVLLTKVSVTQERFERFLYNNKIKVTKDAVDAVNNFFIDVLTIVKQVGIRTADLQASYMSVIPIFIEINLHRIRFLLSQTSHECATAVTSMQSILKSAEESLSDSVHLTLWRACIQCLQCGIVLRQDVAHASKVNKQVVLQLINKSRKVLNLENWAAADLSTDDLRLLNSCCILGLHDSQSSFSMKADMLLALSPDLQDSILAYCKDIIQLFHCEEQALQKLTNDSPESIRRVQKPQEEIILLYTLRLVMLRSHVEKLLNGGGIKKAGGLLQQCQTEMAEYKQWLESSSTTSSTSIMPDDFLRFGKLAHQFGGTCYHVAADEEAVPFLRLGTSAISIWYERAKPDAERIARHQIWNKCMYLVESERTSGNHAAAMEALTTGLTIDPSSLMKGAEKFVKVKMDLSITNPKSSLLHMSLWSLVKSMGRLEVEQVLHAEFKACKASRWKNVEHQQKLLEELLSITKDRGKRACYLLDKTHLFWVSKDETSALERCEEALNLLESLAAKQKGAALTTTLDLLASAYLWHYIIEEVELTDVQSKFKTNEPNSRPGSPTPSGPDSRPSSPTALNAEDDPNFFQKCITLEMEHETFKMADRALELWEEVMQNTDGAVECINSSLGHLAALAAIYRLAQRLTHELRTLHLISQMALHWGTSANHQRDYLQAQTHAINIYCHLRQSELAAIAITATDAWLEDKKKLKATHPYIWYLQAKVKTHLLQAQVEEAAELLKVALALKSDLLKDKSKDALRLDGCLKQLQYQITSLPPEYLTSDSLREELMVPLDNVVELQLKSSRSISGVVTFMFGSWVLYSSEKAEQKGGGSNSMEKWCVMSELLDSLYDTGQAFVQLGLARDARCYFNQGVRIAQSFILPRRFLSFHLALGKLDTLSAHHSACIAHLNTCNYVLKATTKQVLAHQLVKVKHGKSSESCRNVISKKVLAKRLDSCEAAESDDESSDILHGKVEMRGSLLDDDENEDKWNSPDVSSPPSCSSPSLKHKGVSAPQHWRHHVDCVCLVCGDVEGCRLQLTAIACEAESLQQQGHVSQAKLYWDLFKHMDSVTKRGQKCLQRLSFISEGCVSKKKAQLTIHQDPDIQPTLYQDLLVQVYMRLTEQALIEHDWSTYEDMQTKLADLVDVTHNQSLMDMHPLRAQSHYFTTVPDMLSSEQAAGDSVEHIINQLKSLNIKTKITPDNFIPHTPNNPLPAVNSRKLHKNRKMERSDSNAGKKDSGDRSGQCNIDLDMNELSSKVVLNNESEADPLSTPASNAACQPAAVCKTPANKLKVKGRDPIMNSDLRSTFKTPHGTNYRRAILDMLLDTDSEEEGNGTDKTSDTKAPSEKDKASKIARKKSSRKSGDVSSPARGSGQCDPKKTGRQSKVNINKLTPVKTPANRHPKAGEVSAKRLEESKNTVECHSSENGEKNPNVGQDNGAVLKSAYKTPARKIRPKGSDPLKNVSSEYLNSGKTPHGVKTSQTPLKISFNVDDGRIEEVKKTTNSRRKPSSNQSIPGGSRRGSRKASDASVLTSVTDKDSRKVGDDTKKKSLKGPVINLFKSSLNKTLQMEIGERENVYDFDLEEDDENKSKMKGKTRAAPKKSNSKVAQEKIPKPKAGALRGRRTNKREADIEVARQQDDSIDAISMATETFSHTVEDEMDGGNAHNSSTTPLSDDNSRGKSSTCSNHIDNDSPNMNESPDTQDYAESKNEDPVPSKGRKTKGKSKCTSEKAVAGGGRRGRLTRSRTIETEDQRDGEVTTCDAQFGLHRDDSSFELSVEIEACDADVSSCDVSCLSVSDMLASVSPPCARPSTVTWAPSPEIAIYACDPCLNTSATSGQQNNDTSIEVPRDAGPNVNMNLSDLDFSFEDNDDVQLVEEILLNEDASMYLEDSSVSLLELYNNTPDRDNSLVSGIAEIRPEDSSVTAPQPPLYTIDTLDALIDALSSHITPPIVVNDTCSTPSDAPLTIMQVPNTHSMVNNLYSSASELDHSNVMNGVLNLSCSSSDYGSPSELSTECWSRSSTHGSHISHCTNSFVSPSKRRSHGLTAHAAQHLVDECSSRVSDNHNSVDIHDSDGSDIPVISAKKSYHDEPIEIPRSGSDTEDQPTRRNRRGAAARGRGRRKVTQRSGSEEVQEGAEVERSSSVKVKASSNQKAVVTKTASNGQTSLPISVSGSGCNSEEMLLHAYQLLHRHPAVLPYRSVCQALGLLYLSEPSKAAFFLTEAQAISFRHKTLINISRKLRKFEKPDDECGVDSVTRDMSKVRLSSGTLTMQEQLGTMKKQLNFGKSPEDFETLLENLPQNMVICQVTVIQTPGSKLGQLLVTRFLQGQPPVILSLPGFTTTQSQKVLEEFSQLMHDSKETFLVKDRLRWWASREDMNDKLKDIVDGIEWHMLGCWQGILYGLPVNEDDFNLLNKITKILTTALQQEAASNKTVDPQLVQILLMSASKLRAEEIAVAVHHLTGVEDANKLDELVGLCQHHSKPLILSTTNRHHVCLILDKELQHLPWESIPCLRGQPITRMPSLHFLHAHHQLHTACASSVYNLGINFSETFYVVDPENNLPFTADMFGDKFKKEYGWTGVMQQRPTEAEFANGLINYDLFVYAGHGTGKQFLSGESLQLLCCHAAVILMGCSSGKLVAEGQLEAAGMMLNYFLAGAPCVVANLWDVTDRDTDRYLEEVLKRLKKGNTSLVETFHKSRDTCRLPYLIGAAPVVYGLPVTIYTS